MKMKKIFLVLASVALIISCEKDDDGGSLSFEHTILPSNINDLFEGKGDANSDTVWVYSQGGPVTEREYGFEDQYDDGSDAYPFITDDYRVYTFQTQHLNSNIALDETFTFEHAKVEAAMNSEIVKRVVEYFTQQNKVVYLVGHSYGSLVVNDVLARYGSIARKTISLNGRLDMDQVVWEAFSKGEMWTFDGNGENPSYNSAQDDLSVSAINMKRLAAGLGYNRYTTLLSNVDLSDAIFLTSTKDEQVGDFTQEAIDLLNDKAEALLSIDGGHGDVYHPVTLKQIHDTYIITDN